MDISKDNIHDTSKLASKQELAAKEIFYSHIVPLAEESFIHDGELSPMVFIFMDDEENGKVAIAPMPAQMFMESEDKKELLSELLRDMAGKLDILGIGMFSEAWMTRVDKLTNEAEEKTEICFFSFESENLVCMKQNTVIRPEDKEKGKIDFKYGDIVLDHTMTGKFVGFLKDMKKVKNN